MTVRKTDGDRILAGRGLEIAGVGLGDLRCKLGLDLRVLFAFLGAKADAKDAALSPLELARDVQIRRAEDGEITHVLFRGLEDRDFLFDLDARERVAPLLVPFALLCLLLGLDLALRRSSGLQVVVDRLVSGLSMELQKRIV